MFKLKLRQYPGNKHYIERYISFISGVIKRGVTENNYTEKHHILPRSLFPEYEDNKENIIVLSGREHFIAHWILAEAYGGPMWYAINQMMHCSEDGRRYDNIPSKIYEKAKFERAKLMSEKMSGEGNYWYGKSRSGEDNPMYGKNHMEQTISKMREARILYMSNYDNRLYGDKNGMYLKKHSEESKLKMSKSKLEFVKTIDEDHYWKKKPEEVIDKMKASRDGKIKALGIDSKERWMQPEDAYYRDGRYYEYSDPSADREVYKKFIEDTYSGRKCYVNSDETKKKKSDARKDTKRVNIKNGSFKYVKKDKLYQYYEHSDGKYYDYPEEDK